VHVPLAPSTPVQFLKGVGEGRAKVLQAAGIETVRDLLFFFPFRYEDRRHPKRIAEIGRSLEQPVLLRGRVVSAASKTSPVRRMKIFEAMFDDGSGSVMLVWFNQPYLSDQIKRGEHLAVYGQPRLSTHGRLQIESPDWEKIDEGDEAEGKIVPIYSKVGNVPPKTLRKMMATALESVDLLDDPMPPDIRDRLGVIPLAPAIRAIHEPPELTPEFLGYRSAAHLRVILEEFFTFQLVMRVRRSADEVRKKSRAIRYDDDIAREILRILPFKLTDAQKRVLREIRDDLLSDRPMYRLLQGDVGSGKTIVALIAAVIMIRNGHQVALLAPTEILVEQHYQRIRQLVDHSLMVAKATGSMTAGERRQLRAGLRDGFIQLVVGTHALLEEKVVFKSLGLAIVDEQHRFGVEQRQRLFAKGDMIDILVMTATPIPRSLALAIFGDLDLSVIDELPPGRQKIRTVLRSTPELERVYKFVDEEIDTGAQIYIVYPLIEESEKLNLKPLSEGVETIRKRFPNRRVAMLHGRMSAAEKEETMAKFKRGEIDILVATTVIEVGIDVPNASIMIIMEADRFGLSQLHQLRGRVGRGERKSWCVLVRNMRAAADSIERLKMFETTRDGFEVAERDLHLRGPGEFLGTRQSGVPRFRFGNILRDFDLMEKARDAAIDLVEKEGVPQAEEVARRMLGETVDATRD